MSGTSADGVTAVLSRISGAGVETRFRVVASKTYRYPKWLRERIFELFDPLTGTVDKICVMNFVLGEVFASVVGKIAGSAEVDVREIDCIASHGQTIYHSPEPVKQGPWTVGSTLQIGEPAVIADKTGVTVISNFRAKDVSAGGQGAPLVSYPDYLVFRSRSKGRAVLNLGGIANVTVIPAGASVERVWAFDTGPGNMVIDYVAQRLSNGRIGFDKWGKIAAKGTVKRAFLNRMLRHPFFHKVPPKSTGREEFGSAFSESLLKTARKDKLDMSDVIATTTTMTVESIRLAFQRFILPKARIHEVIVGGGGVRNKVLMNGLKKSIPARILTMREFGIPNQAKEALSFCILANETLHGNPSNIPLATGAQRRVVLGSMTPAR
jgi:anhydro-N-acetylmuramic acid kinase